MSCSSGEPTEAAESRELGDRMDRVNRFLQSNLGLSIGDIGPIALTLGVAVIIISVVSLVLGTMSSQTYQTAIVENETFNATATDYDYTVEKASDADFVEVTMAQGYETDAQNTEVNTMILDAEAGKLNFEYSSDPTSTTQSVYYEYDEETTSTNIIDKGLESMSVFGAWFDIIVIVSVAAIILGLVMLFRGSARGGGI